MTMLICFVLLLVAALCLWRGRPRSAGWAVAVSIALTLAVGSGAIARSLLPGMQPPAWAQAVGWEPRNSIVLLGAGTTPAGARGRPSVPFVGYGRVASAAAAYFDCRTRGADCKVVVSGGDPSGHGVSEAEVYGLALRALMVPAADLVLEPRSRNTWQNAQFSTMLVPRDRLLVVVTSGFQLRRALLYFSHFRDGVRGHASDFLTPTFSVVPTSENFMVTDALIHEEIGVLRYHVYNALGWNAPRTPDAGSVSSGKQVQPD